MTYISLYSNFVLYPEDFSHSSDFALYLEEYFKFKHHTQYDLKFDLRINGGHTDLYFMVQ